MDDLRWFAPNRYCTLPVARLRGAGLRIATEGDEPARLVFASDGASVAEAFRYAWRQQRPLAVYLWDLPPWQTGRGRSNLIIALRGSLIKIPRVWGAFPERNGYYSRLRYVARHAAAVWTPSANSAQDLRERFGVAAAEVPFCFDSDRFHRSAGWRKPGGVPVVLSVSRLVAHKNHAAVIRAAALVSSRPRVHLIGAGPEAGPLRQLAAQLDVELAIDENWRSDEQILAAYLAASVVVSASRFEGLGLTPLEAIALGIPTVASDIPTHREFVAGHARLVPLDDDVALASAIDNALRFDVAPAAAAPHPLPELTIEACAARLLPRFEALLHQAR